MIKIVLKIRRKVRIESEESPYRCRKILHGIWVLFAAVLLLNGCGEKLDLSQFPISNNGNINVADTLYILQTPVWNGFNRPEDVLLGNEPLVYVADTKNNRIVQMDIAGGTIGEIAINNPRKLAQDYNFDLLVIADSVVSTSDTVSIVYRINIVGAGGNISNASKLTYIKSTYATPNSSTLRKFTGIAVLTDNSVLITRVGPEDQFGIDPGNAILKVTGRTTAQTVTVLPGFQSSGSSFYSIENVSGICGVRNSSTDFIITRSTPDTTTLNKVLWFMYDNVNGTYDPKFTESSLGIVSAKFGKPDDVVQDPNQSVFVIDSYRNYLWKFNVTGKLMSESFGGLGTESGKFNNPKGIAFYNKVIYIADTDNNRIVRYRLSTDLN